ncbi:MAG: hypothetical protein IKV87_01520, partial [Methanobrevibacter sp.]|nr:hypothetical protein [Methanobrevibacter sp.]
TINKSLDDFIGFDNQSAIEDLKYLDSIKAWKHVDKIMNNIKPSNLDELYSFDSNNIVSKFNWDKKELYDVLFKNKSSIFVPLGSFQALADGYYLMDNHDVIASDNALFSHEDGSYGLLIKLDMNQVQFEYAYCEKIAGLSLDGENCDLNTLSISSAEDLLENYIFDSLSKISLFN